MKNLKSYFQQLGLLFTIILLGYSNSYASHNVGCTITYSCLGSNQYEFTMVCYRDCSGATMSTSKPLTFTSASCGNLTDLILTIDSPNSGIDKSQLCNSTLSNCQGGTLSGVQQWVYTGIKTLPASCVWTVKYEECCRGGIITNLDNASLKSSTVFTTVNTTSSPCNNSVQFTNPPLLYTCDSTLTYYNHGFYDPDGDSLVFSLTEPLETLQATLPFVAGLSYSNPLFLEPTTTFDFDSTTGQLVFRPLNNTAQTATITIKIEEVRNGVVIATTIRELLIVVQTNCNSNNAPIVEANTFQGSAISMTNSNLELCRGNFAEFNLIIKDLDGDSLSISSNIATAIPGAILNYTITPYQVDSVLLTFTINSNNLLPGTYPFVININDNACPVPSVQFLGYALMVYGANYGYSTYCQASPDPIPQLYGTSAGLFTQLLSNPLGLVLDTLTGAIDLDSSLVGTYNIIYTPSPNTFCPSDTISVTIVTSPSASFSYPRTLWCQQGMDPTPIITGTLGGTFSGTSGLIINPNTGVIDISETPVGAYVVYYNMVASTCSAQDSFALNVMGMLKFHTTQNKQYICSTVIDTVQLGTVVSYDGIAPSSPTYSWSPNLNINNTTIPNPKVVVGMPQTYYLTYDDGHCFVLLDTVQFVTPLDVAILPTTNVNLCYGDTVQLGAAVVNGEGDYSFVTTGATTLFIEDTTFAILNISGVTSSIINHTLLAGMELNMTLSVNAIGHLTMYLVAPSGEKIIIAKRNGGIGQSLANATFSLVPTNLSLATYTGPFPLFPPNSYILPVGGVTGFNDLLGATINGDWTLMIIHNNSGLSNQNGTITNWGLNFQDLSLTNFVWSPSSANISCITCDSPWVNPSANTFYTVVGTNLFGCMDTAFVNVDVDSAIVLTSNQTSETCVGCSNGNAEIVISSQGTYSYLWNSGVTTALITNLTTGLYCVTITDMVSGCIADTCIQIQLDTLLSNGVYNLKNDKTSLTILNNPISTNVIPLIIESLRDTKVSIHIYTIDSKELVFLPQINLKTGANRLDIPFDNLTNGVYIIVLKSDLGVLQQQKIIIQL